MATISQEFSKIVKYEEDLQNQYRIIFLNLINIYLDSLVQQKMIEPEQKQEMSDEFSARLRETESEWRSKIKASIRVRTVPLLYSTAIIAKLSIRHVSAIYSLQLCSDPETTLSFSIMQI